MLLYYRLVYRLSLTQKKDSSKDGRSYEDRRDRIDRMDLFAMIDLHYYR